MNFIEHHGHEVIGMGPRNWLYEDGRELYKLDGIEKADTIIDLGACFGGFTLMAYEVAPTKSFVAVEPVWYDILQINMEKNNIPCRVWAGAIAHPKDEKGWALMDWDGRAIYSRKLAMKEILKVAEGKDRKVFLKCDIEMGEWNLQPEDFTNVIRVEIEIHNLHTKQSGTFIQHNPELVAFLEETYFIEAEDNVIATADGAAKVFHMYRKDTFPEKENVAGPVSEFMGL